MNTRLRVWIDVQLAGRDRDPEGPTAAGWDLYEDTERVAGVVKSFETYPGHRQWHLALADLIEDGSTWAPSQRTFPL
jgi:hypothetical protein